MMMFLLVALLALVLLVHIGGAFSPHTLQLRVGGGRRASSSSESIERSTTRQYDHPLVVLSSVQSNDNGYVHRHNDNGGGQSGKTQSSDNVDDVKSRHDSISISSRREWFMKLSSASSATAASILTLGSQNAFAEESMPTSTLADSPIATLTPTLSPEDSNNILCDPSVSIFYNPRKKRTVYLLGTAHISSKSADAAAQLVRDIKPKAVFVELDAKRVGRAIPKPDSETWPGIGKRENSDDFGVAGSVNSSSSSGVGGVGSGSVTQTVTAAATATATAATAVSSEVQSSPSTPLPAMQQPIKQPKFFDFREMALRKGSEIVGNSIKGLYSKLEAEGFNAGEEFVVAVKEGLKLNSKIILGDRDVEVTLRRLTEALAKTDLKKLLAADSELEENMKQLMPKDMNVDELQKNGGDMTSEQLKYFVETVKAKDNVRLLMSNLKSVAPEVYQAMVAERDEYMANGLDQLDQFESIVAVMGIAHVDGVESTLKSRGWQEVKVKCDA